MKMRIGFLFLCACTAFVMSCDDHSLAISPETQLATDIKLIDDFLAKNNLTAQIHDSGLRYIIAEEGAGDRPGPETCVRVNYTMWLLGETDPAYQVADVAFALSQARILGWRIGLKEIQKGGTITLYLPSALAYGTTGGQVGETKIPKNQCLIYMFEVTNITQFNEAAGYCYPWPS